MSDENLPEKNDIEIFIADPKNAEQVNLLRSAHNYFMAENAAAEIEARTKDEAERAKNKPAGIFDWLLGNNNKDGE